MTNLRYLRDACFELMHVDCKSDFYKLVSPWLHINDSSAADQIYSARVLHSVDIIDAFFDSIFTGSIAYYSTIYIRDVRFTTADYARGKISNDSFVVFKDGSQSSFGRIRRIFVVNDSDTMLHVSVLHDITYFQCEIATGTQSYRQIQTGTLDDETNNLFINPSAVVEKCVCYERPKKRYTFYRFPNLQESS